MRQPLQRPSNTNPPRHVVTNNPGSSPNNVSSLSSGRSNTTNITDGASNIPIPNTDQNLIQQRNHPRRRTNECPSPLQSRKKPRYRPNQVKKKKKLRKDRKILQRQFRSNVEQSIRNDP